MTIPAGTVVYGEIQEQVTSRKGDTFEGDLVQAIIWRDVIVARKVVIKAGTPMVVKVSLVKRAKMAGIKGKLELRAFSATALDSTHIPLVGGYDKSGRGKMALAITLGALFIIPIIIKGKQAVLEPGTVFDSQVQANTEIEIEATTGTRRISLSRGPTLSVEVLYDEIPEKGELKELPLSLVLCGSPGEDAQVVGVNESEIEPFDVAIPSVVIDGDCQTGTGSVNLKALGEHFTRGINRFVVRWGGVDAEVVMDIEL